METVKSKSEDEKAKIKIGSQNIWRPCKIILRMDTTKKSRAVVRTIFTKNVKIFHELTSEAEPDLNGIEVRYQLIKGNASQLQVLDEQCFNYMLENGADEAALCQEVEKTEEYKATFLGVEYKYQELQTASDGNSTVQTCVKQTDTIRLPKIELFKFDGQIQNWLRFWAQFKKIDESKELSKEDKFHYLTQSIVPGTRASDLINSFPPTSENYDKAIDSLKTRFGKTDLLVEFYIRELLQLVMSNLTRSNEKFEVTSLYDKLESHLRALESLKITKESCAPLLYPLVESSLPEELLRTWQRHTTGISCEPKGRLSALLEFLKAEVDNEERITMAMRGFAQTSKTAANKCERAIKKPVEEGLPTASGLVAGKTVEVCVFCDKNHESTSCQEAKKLSWEQRSEKAKEKRACFRCLQRNHGFKFCYFNKKCDNCGNRHVSVMCRGSGPSESSSKQTQDKEVPTTASNISVNQDVFLQTLKVELINGKGETKVVRGLIDTGSQYSYLLKTVAKEMEYLPIDSAKFQHGLFGGSTSLPETHHKYKITVKNLLSPFTCQLEVFDKDVICVNIPTLKGSNILKKLVEKEISVTDIDDSQPISLLIGADMTANLLTGNILRVTDQVTAVETKLGWSVIGKDSLIRRDETLLVVALHVHEASVSDLWRMDVLGISDPIETKSREDHLEYVKQNFLETTTINGEGRYEVVLPWKENHPPLLCNKDLAYKRLEKVTKKLKEENLFEAYRKVFHEWEEEGIIEKVPEHLHSSIDCFYLPHRHVVKLSSLTTPIRPVFDASAHVKGSPSLNQCLETGTNFVELIPNLLLRFREKKLGVISDIRKAFLQISITPKDRDVLRFLWWDNQEPSKLLIYRHCRVVFGLTCSPFLLGATIERHLLLYSPVSDIEREVVVKLLNSYYVDNSIVSVDSKEDMEEFRKVAVKVMNDGGFELRCWEYTGQAESPETTSVLGMRWNKIRDTLSLCELNIEPNPECLTKRFILSSFHKIFDSVGLVCPILLCPKLLFRKLCISMDWDSEVGEEDKLIFLEWYSQLHLLKMIEIPRWLFGVDGECVSIQFHMFSDASQHAYAAVIFVRVESVKETTVRFVQAKSRVAPKAHTSIPRLELLAATIGTRLMKSVLSALKYEGKYPVFYWSDSTTVLSWIQRNNQWARFVWNRVQEIRSLSELKQWFFVPGEINPADLPSRGCNPRQLLQSEWWNGPGWLKGTESTWPKGNFETDEEAIRKEMKKDCVVNLVSHILDKSCWFTRYFSDYPKIVRMIGWIYRFLRNCRQSEVDRGRGDLSASEYHEAEHNVLRLAQQESFSSMKDVKLSDFVLFVDGKGLIRIRTPIANKCDEYPFRHPVVLDYNHELTTRLIEYEHRRHSHAGVQTLLNSLREQFWILRGRKTVRSVVNRCRTCKRYNSKNYQEMSPPLPANRVNMGRVFQVIGVDYAGPLFLRDKKKVWICLFTCAVYRAVHLELVSSLTAEGFLLAFKRFVARRGSPSVVYSDNGTNFVAARKALQIDWHFNPPTAAWWGGFFERMVGVVKDILRKILKNARLDYEALLTALCDCEAIVNSRPITYVSDDPTEPRPLTPAMFLKDITEDSSVDVDVGQSNDTVFTQHLLRSNRIRASLKSRFRKEYLGALKNRKGLHDLRDIEVDDIVLIGNDMDKRLLWPLARVVELIKGKDGKVRVVRLKTSKGELVRPIQRLFPLEK